MQDMKNLEKAKQILSQKNADAMLINSEVNMHYFCDFSPSEGIVLITKSDCYHIVDSRYTETAKNHAEKTGLEVIEILSAFTDVLNELFNKHNIDTVLFENETISLAKYKLFSSKLNAQLVELGNEIEQLRNVKSVEEKEKIRNAQKIAESAYLELLNHIEIGKSEKELCAYFDYLMAKNGSDGVSFSTILLSGARTSMPHGVPSDNTVKKGDFVLFDFGATLDGYHSDTTRTVCVGNPTEEQQFVYNLVLKAQLAGIDALKAGKKCSDVYYEAYNVLDKEGYAQYFRHSLGHCVGLEIHEGYSSSPTSNDIYQVGNVTSVEPGVYLPGKFGIRIEDILYVTENGSENLVTLDKELIVL